MVQMITLAYQFCYWDCRSYGDLTIMLFNAIVALLFIIYCVRIYLKSSSISEKQSHRFIYLLIIFWGITCVFSNLYSIITYHFYLHGNQQWRGLLTLHSRMFAVAVSLPFIVIMFLLSYIPYTMMNNMYEILNMKNVHLSKKQYLFYSRLLKNYLKIKPFIVIVPLIFLLVPDQYPEFYVHVTDIRLILFVVDCLTDGVILIFCRSFIKKKFKLLNCDTKRDMKRLIRQIDLLTFSSFCRFLGYLYLAIFARRMFIYQQDRYYTVTRCLQPMQEHYIYSFGYLMLTTWVVNFLPIYVAAKMYHPDFNRMKGIQQQEFVIVEQ